MESFQPTHMLDMTKMVRFLSSASWLSITRHGALTSVPCQTIGEPIQFGAHLVKVRSGEHEEVFLYFNADADALTPLPTTPTVVGHEEPDTRKLQRSAQNAPRRPEASEDGQRDPQDD